MERVIDRKEYRRSNEVEKESDEEKVETWQRRIKMFLMQALGASVILLVVSFLKFFNKTDILEKIDNALDDEITISSLKENRTNNSKQSSKMLPRIKCFCRRSNVKKQFINVSFK